MVHLYYFETIKKLQGQKSTNVSQRLTKPPGCKEIVGLKIIFTSVVSSSMNFSDNWFHLQVENHHMTCDCLYLPPSELSMCLLFFLQVCTLSFERFGYHHQSSSMSSYGFQTVSLFRSSCRSSDPSSMNNWSSYISFFINVSGKSLSSRVVVDTGIGSACNKFKSQYLVVTGVWYLRQISGRMARLLRLLTSVA